MFPKIGVPQNGWFMMEKPIRMDDLGGKPTFFGNINEVSSGALKRDRPGLPRTIDRLFRSPGFTWWLPFPTLGRGTSSSK